MKRIRNAGRILAVLVIVSLLFSQASLALTRDERRTIMKSCVLIMPLDIQDGEVVNVPWSGSGTIIDKNGLILTNYHVVEETGEWNALGILVTSRSDQKPEPAYLAEVVAQDPDADLAVLQIVSDFEGKPVDFDKLGLVPVPMGDADNLELGDEITIFGYPGIGAGTITLTEGKIAGFLTDEAITYQRAWLKTDASIAGGNSGGTAVDEYGNLVGVPTRGSMVDVRRIADTNGDGIVDEEDSAVPTGGFINLLRPINLAFGLIAQASSGSVTPGGTSPRTDPTPTSAGILPSGVSFSKFAFASQVDEDMNPLDSGSSFSTDLTTLYAYSDYQGMRDGLELRYIWTVDDQQLFDKALAWSYGPKGSFYLYITNDDDPLPPGKYQLEVIVAGKTVQKGQAVIGSYSSPSSTPGLTSDGVTLSGTVYDAYTDEPIPGAGIIILKPGVTVASFLRTQKQSSIAAYGETDSQGYFVSAPELARGKTYGAIIIAKGYESLTQDKALSITVDMPVDLELEPVMLAPQ